MSLLDKKKYPQTYCTEVDLLRKKRVSVLNVMILLGRKLALGNFKSS